MTLLFGVILIMSAIYFVVAVWNHRVQLAMYSVAACAFALSQLMLQSLGAEFGTARLIALISACLLFLMISYGTIMSMSNSRKGSTQESKTEQHVQVSKVN